MHPDAPLKIFIIYAHEDRGFKEDLLKRLKLLRSQGLIAPWHDRDLVAGDDWDKVIRGHLAVADIILPIISIDFFNSDYIEQVEIVEAFERYEQGKAHILPIIARQCRWEDDPRIAKLQALPENGLPIAKWLSADDAFDSVYDGIKAKIAEIRSAAAHAEAEIFKINEAQRAKETTEALAAKQEIERAAVEKAAEAKRLAAQKAKEVEGRKLEEEKRAMLFPEMISVKGGTFRLGDKVECTLSDFAMGKYPVTFEEYDHYCEAMKIAKPADEGWGRGKRPVINVSWFDVAAYCNWLSEQSGLAPAYKIEKEQVARIAGSKGYRLPTEAEWEFAARGGTLSNGYEFAGSNNLDEVGWYWENSGDKRLSGKWDIDSIKMNNGRSHPVGEKRANELGFHDLSGNVWEWCWDWYGDYPASKQVDPQGAESGNKRVLRGGSFYVNVDVCRAAYRVRNGPVDRYNLYGCRAARHL